MPKLSTLTLPMECRYSKIGSFVVLDKIFFDDFSVPANAKECV